MLAIYVPAPGSPGCTGIIEGSGIVGTPAAEDRVLIDYEGARYDQVNMVTWADRLVHAAGRHTQRYPTVARRVVRASELLEVGQFDPDECRAYLDGEHNDALVAWLGIQGNNHVDTTMKLAVECRTSSGRGSGQPPLPA